ncbi:hypothetical protein WR25_14023 [Diploscapter pachys]|uniref:Late endosomal/lysosomal adaptor and MAPK and MTOR activator 4 n=1 Tax=Diploscapter pachys TaxID=2018661 RepID=A0A2A2KVY0_9BILA|nr:hypothetical protein WR25_14023 [Diploscapter pachys]
MSKEKDISASQFTFLQKIPDQLGYLIISGDAVVKSDGELVNNEHIAKIVPRMISLSKLVFTPNAGVSPPKFQQITVTYTDHFYTIARSGKYVFVVKRKSQN